MPVTAANVATSSTTSNHVSQVTPALGSTYLAVCLNMASRRNRSHTQDSVVVNVGIKVAKALSVVEEQGNERERAQRESPAEREAKKNPAEKQDLENPPEGRDEPPAETLEQGKRSPKSPWMGGG
jgi:hypothetical protein